MQICSKCQSQWPDSVLQCSQCGAELREWSNTAVALKRFKQNPRVNYVRIIVAHDCCPACQHAEGTYAKDSAPELPIPGCSHSLGCRCFYAPALEVIYP